MDEKTEATLVASQGLLGNTDRSRRRQVTIIEREAWDAATKEAGVTASPAGRRANLMVSGVSLANTRGRVLRVGSVRLAIGGETTPCERMDEVAPGLRAALRPDWRGGVFAQVLDDGLIRIGDEVTLSERDEGSGDRSRGQRSDNPEP